MWQRLKCWLGWHDWIGDYLDDHKGNHGIVVYCRHCHEIEIV